ANTVFQDSNAPELLPHGAASAELTINTTAAATAALPNCLSTIDTAPRISAPQGARPPKLGYPSLARWEVPLASVRRLATLVFRKSPQISLFSACRAWRQSSAKRAAAPEAR